MNMKKNTAFIIIILLLSVVVFNSVSFAQEVVVQQSESYFDRSLHKLGRGVHDVLFCPAELAVWIRKDFREGTIPQAVTAGFVKGIGHMVARAAVGVYETGTFLVPQKPILNPEFFFSGAF